MEFLQRLDEQIIDRHPNRAAPVRVATEYVGLRFGWLIAHDFLLAVKGQHIRMLLVKFADRTYAVVAEEFFRIEHASQQTFHPMTACQGNEPAFTHPRFLPS